MKAILVIDMPKCCRECMFSMKTNKCLITDNFIKFNELHSKCPLKEISHYDYMSPRYIAENPSDDYFNGWNDCKNEILGEQENE